MADDERWNSFRSWSDRDRFAHPDSPSGGGGPGGFHQAGPLGTGDDWPLFSRLPHPRSPAGRYLAYSGNLNLSLTTASIWRIIDATSWDAPNARWWYSNYTAAFRFERYPRGAIAMIPITKEIMGPGIQEEYADALSRIDALLTILKPFPETNDTAEGRVKLELQWLKQEIEEEHLPLPVERRFIATLRYVMTEGSLDHLGNFAQLADELATVLDEGLVKPRHYPVVAAMITDAVDMIPAPTITPTVTSALDDLKKIQNGLLSGSIQLPFSREEWSLIFEIPWEDIPGMPFAVAQAMLALHWTFFDGIRPRICRKGPLPAPKPGLRVDLSRSRR